MAAGLCMAAVAAQAPQSPADKAILAWEKAKGGKQKTAALQQLAVLDDPRAEDILVVELTRAGNGAYAVTVINAIAKKPRPSLLPALQKSLTSTTSGSVRSAAARVIGKSGAQGIDILLDMAGKDGVSVPLRGACLSGLAAAGDDRAWRGMAVLAMQGSAADKLVVLRQLESVRDVTAVTKARLALVDGSDEVLAAVAWRQLAAEGHPRAEWKFEDLIEGLGRSIDAKVAAEVVGGFPYVLDEDYYETCVRIASDKNSAVRQAFRRVAPKLGKDAGFTSWLVESVLRRGTPDEREVALIVLRAAPPAAVKDLVAEVRVGLKRVDRNALDLVIGLHDLLAKDPTWADDLLRLAESRDVDVKAVGLSMMLEMGAPGAIGIAQKCLSHKRWELRSLAFRYLTKFRDLSSIPLLIARFEREEGRLDGELSDALFVHTGTRCWKKSEWTTWWARNKDSHQLPAEQTVFLNRKSSGGSTVSYYGIPLSSRNCTFLIDISGSMNAKVGTNGNRTRLDEAKRQLLRVVEQMDKDYEFNVVIYQTGLEPAWEQLQRASKANKEEVSALIRELTPRGGTNIHDALELAFDDPEVDTIYLLTDGDPSAGRITNPDDLADAVRRWNYRRQVVVHCVSIGKESKLLKRLAAESRGEYVHVK